MVAMSNFADMVKTAIAEKADIIFSGAGLPLNLPSFLTEDAKTKMCIRDSHHGVHLLLAGHVADVAFGLDALGLVGGQAFVHQLLFDVVEDDFCALTCESRCQCESDAVRGARHERDLTFQ